jgi:hypothetical protein
MTHVDVQSDLAVCRLPTHDPGALLGMPGPRPARAYIALLLGAGSGRALQPSRADGWKLDTQQPPCFQRRPSLQPGTEWVPRLLLRPALVWRLPEGPETARRTWTGRRRSDGTARAVPTSESVNLLLHRIEPYARELAADAASAAEPFTGEIAGCEIGRGLRMTERGTAAAKMISYHVGIYPYAWFRRRWQL